ncbi:MAG: hypothetical protein EZS28_008111 [Streblomastix strix]|uniref:Uncharacterized protein n=1 Tax=Streblomastix strix TaxID=222440 RepID=A0A5J4WPQ7_9EUKA|nr:MAG: hypothetical protein EZS28_008111 [Streblomastix strix]
MIGRLNILRTQFDRESLYLVLIVSAKTRAVKTQRQTGIMVSPLDALKELCQLNRKIADNKKQQKQDPIPQATIVRDDSFQGGGTTLELDSVEVLIAQGTRLSYRDILNKQQERTAGHSLRNICFRNSFQIEADNQSSNQIRLLYSSIRFKQAESNRHCCTSSEGYLPHLPTFKYENITITYRRKDKHNSKCSQQIVQVRRLSPSPIISGSNKNDLKHPTNSRSNCIINNKTITSVYISEFKGQTTLMNRRILQYMVVRNINRTPLIQIAFKCDFISQQ